MDAKQLHEKMNKTVSFSNKCFHENKTGSVMMKTHPRGGCLCIQFGGGEEGVIINSHVTLC